MDPQAPRLAAVGGMHGHEAQGPAACFNLLSVLRTGADLKGQAWPELQKVNWSIVFVLNPDGRARMPNSFVGLSVQDVLNYDAGLLLDGNRKDHGGDVKPEEALILGGLYNDDGVDILRSVQHPPELQAAFGFLARERPVTCLEFHAHCANPVFYCPLMPTPPEVVRRQIELAEAIATTGSAAGYGFSARTSEVHGLTTALYWDLCGAVPMLFESPQGVLDRGPRWDHARIVDANLFVLSELARLHR